MKRITNKGNMPGHIAAFAKQLTGQMVGQKETEFWEASSINEFEKNAIEIGYEIVPAMDMSTTRGYLTGFEVTDSIIVGPNDQSYVQLKMYYIEVSEEEFNAWVRKINNHRELQQEDHFLRREKRETKLKKTSPKEPK